MSELSDNIQNYLDPAPELAAAVSRLRSLAVLVTSVADSIENNSSKELPWWATHSQGIGYQATQVERALSMAFQAASVAEQVKSMINYHQEQSA